MILNVPPASPGSAASQKSCELERLKPTPGRRTTSADTRNQTMNASVRLAVVMTSVRQASVLPVASQKLASSGVQRSEPRSTRLLPELCCFGRGHRSRIDLGQTRLR